MSKAVWKRGEWAVDYKEQAPNDEKGLYIQSTTLAKGIELNESVGVNTEDRWVQTRWAESSRIYGTRSD